MTTRRSFLVNTVTGSVAILAGDQIQAAVSNEQAYQGRGYPVVLSTWDFGMAANDAAWQVIQKKGRALDAVEAGVRVCEADPENQTVGYGGFPDRDGHVTLDACIMDDKYNCGSVMCLKDIMHPISVARLVMEKTPHIILTGEGAQQFAVANGFKTQNLLTPASEKAWKEWLKTADYKPQMNIENQSYQNQRELPVDLNNHDTIGMVAVDMQGNISG